jgi:hypothetical protein
MGAPGRPGEGQFGAVATTAQGVSGAHQSGPWELSPPPGVLGARLKTPWYF